MNAITPNFGCTVIRFPVERRLAPTAALVHRTAPSHEQACAAAALLGLDQPSLEIRESAGMEAGLHIAEHIAPLAPSERAAAFEALLASHVASALSACRRLDDAERLSASASDRLSRAKAEPGFWVEEIAAEAEGLALRAVGLLGEAHALCETVRGVERAIELGRHGSSWTAPTGDELGEWLCEDQAAAAARRAV